MEIASLALMAGGLAVSTYGAIKSTQFQQKSLNLQREAEKTRQQQMNLEAMRRRREIIRNSEMARAQAMAIASAQGASDGSGIEGALGQIQGASGRGILGVNQNEELGNRLFDINSQITDNSIKQAGAQTWSTIGGAMSSLGGMGIKNADTVRNFFKTNPYQFANTVSWGT
jgi:hypothetical protein